MTTTEYLECRSIKNASRLTERERISICKHILSSQDYEACLPEGKIHGSRFVDSDAKALGITIDWRG